MAEPAAVVVGMWVNTGRPYLDRRKRSSLQAVSKWSEWYFHGASKMAENEIATKPPVGPEYISEVLGCNPLMLNYLTHLSHKYKYVYVSTAKGGSTFILRQLQFIELGGQGDVSQIKPHIRESSPLAAPLTSFQRFKKALEDDEYLKFCFVRNPFTRALSCYLDKFVQNDFERQRLNPKLGFPVHARPTFTEFLRYVAKQPEGERDIHWENQAFQLRPDRIAYGFIGRFENFGPEYDRLLAMLGMEKIPNNKDTHRTSSGSKLLTYYGPEEVKLVQEIYKRDFLAFGYGSALKAAI